MLKFCYRFVKNHCFEKKGVESDSFLYSTFHKARFAQSGKQFGDHEIENVIGRAATIRYGGVRSGVARGSRSYGERLRGSVFARRTGYTRGTRRTRCARLPSNAEIRADHLPPRRDTLVHPSFPRITDGPLYDPFPKEGADRRALIVRRGRQSAGVAGAQKNGGAVSVSPLRTV